jgi:hypothetical protein
MTSPADIKHLRPVRPLHFPSSQPEWDLGQSIRHLDLCTMLREILLAAVTRSDSVGSDQFVYFDASRPKRCLAPDGMVKLGVPQESFESWKTWERGTPELGIEILSPSDTPETITFEEKLERYHAAGVRELVVFHVDGRVGARLRAWDRIDGDLVERAVANETTPCLTLGLWFVLRPGNDEPVALRLARDEAGVDLLPTEREKTAFALRAEGSERQAKEAERQGKEAERQAKEAALSEVARLQALLGERGLRST